LATSQYLALVQSFMTFLLRHSNATPRMGQARGRARHHLMGDRDRFFQDKCDQHMRPPPPTGSDAQRPLIAVSDVHDERLSTRRAADAIDSRSDTTAPARHRRSNLRRLTTQPQTGTAGSGQIHVCNDFMWPAMRRERAKKAPGNGMRNRCFGTRPTRSQGRRAPKPDSRQP
jgi:hypothetical protein